jgi:toxin ParE1/3/4
MAKFKLTNKAVDDLTKIGKYTFEEWLEVKADNYYEMIISNFKEIASHPNGGKKFHGVY